MPGQTTKLTDREKAAIFALAAGLIDDTKTAYIIADQKPEKEVLKQTSLKSSVSRWLNSDKVQNTLKAYQRYFADRDAEERRKGREEASRQAAGNDEGQEGNKAGESNHTETKQTRTVDTKIDYNDPKARRQLYNRIITEAADDPKTQLDAAKLIEQTQRDDRQAAQDQKVQRVFLPATCQACPMYAKAQAKRPK